MKQGYIAICESTAGDGIEIFGVYRSREKAVKALKRVARDRLERVPRDFDKMIDALEEIGDGQDSYKIRWFEEY